jgi:hypothetical protein
VVKGTIVSVAQFDGVCGSCGGEIEGGVDEIAWSDDDGWVHTECHPETEWAKNLTGE